MAPDRPVGGAGVPGGLQHAGTEILCSEGSEGSRL